MQVKVKTIRMPNLDSTVNVDTLEADIQTAIKNKIANGYTFTSVTGGDNCLVLIFTK
jgi:hypothetical protein